MRLRREAGDYRIILEDLTDGTATLAKNIVPENFLGAVVEVGTRGQSISVTNGVEEAVTEAITELHVITDVVVNDGVYTLTIGEVSLTYTASTGAVAIAE